MNLHEYNYNNHNQVQAKSVLWIIEYKYKRKSITVIDINQILFDYNFPCALCMYMLYINKWNGYHHKHHNNYMYI